MMAGDMAGERATIHRIDQEDDRIVVHWGDGHRSPYHLNWLRHCLYYPPFSERKDALKRFNLFGRPKSLGPATVEKTDDGHLRVRWAADDRVADFEAAWLRDRCNSARERDRRRLPVVLWDSTIADSLQPTTTTACVKRAGRNC